MSWQFHHVGIVVRNIESYLQQLVWAPRGPAITNPVRKRRAFVCATRPPVRWPSSCSSPCTSGHGCGTRSSAAGDGMILAFRPSPIAAGDALVDERRFLPVTCWEPAVLWGRRPARFVYSRNRELLELLADAVPG